MTYSVANIKTNSISFPPGLTAGYVLSVNTDGSTSWVSHNSGGTGGGYTGPTGPTQLNISIIGPTAMNPGSFTYSVSVPGATISNIIWEDTMNGYSFVTPYYTDPYLDNNSQPLWHWRLGTWDLTAKVVSTDGRFGMISSKITISDTTDDYFISLKPFIKDVIYQDKTKPYNPVYQASYFNNNPDVVYSIIKDAGPYYNLVRDLSSIEANVLRQDGTYSYTCTSSPSGTGTISINKIDKHMNVLWNYATYSTWAFGNSIAYDADYVYVPFVSNYYVSFPPAATTSILRLNKSDGTLHDVIELSGIPENPFPIYCLEVATDGLLFSYKTKVYKFNFSGTVIYSINLLNNTSIRSFDIDITNNIVVPFPLTTVANLLKSYNLTTGSLISSYTHVAGTPRSVNIINGYIYYTANSSTYKYTIGSATALWISPSAVQTSLILYNGFLYYTNNKIDDATGTRTSNGLPSNVSYLAIIPY